MLTAAARCKEIQTLYLKCLCFTSEFLFRNTNTACYRCSLGCCPMTNWDKCLPCCCQKESVQHPIFMPGWLPASPFPSVLSHPSFVLVLCACHREPEENNYKKKISSFLWGTFLWLHPFEPVAPRVHLILEGTGKEQECWQDRRSRSTPLQQWWALGRAVLIPLQPQTQTSVPWLSGLGPGLWPGSGTQCNLLQPISSAPVAFGRRPCPFPGPPRRLQSSAAVVPGLFFEASNKFAFAGKVFFFFFFPNLHFSHDQNQAGYF